MKTEKIVPAQDTTLPGKGVTFGRFFTKPDAHPLDEIKYAKRSSVITNPDGSVVFKMENVEVPESWSQLATDIIVSKYFRKAGVPGTGTEVSARQVVSRIAHAIRTSGEKLGSYFKTPRTPKCSRKSSSIS